MLDGEGQWNRLVGQFVVCIRAGCWWEVPASRVGKFGWVVSVFLYLYIFRHIFLYIYFFCT